MYYIPDKYEIPHKSEDNSACSAIKTANKRPPYMEGDKYKLGLYIFKLMREGRFEEAAELSKQMESMWIS
jgi:hypothetical protein